MYECTDVGNKCFIPSGLIVDTLPTLLIMLLRNILNPILTALDVLRVSRCLLDTQDRISQ